MRTVNFCDINDDVICTHIMSPKQDNQERGSNEKEDSSHIMLDDMYVGGMW